MVLDEKNPVKPGIGTLGMLRCRREIRQILKFLQDVMIFTCSYHIISKFSNVCERGIEGCIQTPHLDYFTRARNPKWSLNQGTLCCNENPDRMFYVEFTGNNHGSGTFRFPTGRNII